MSHDRVFLKAFCCFHVQKAWCHDGFIRGRRRIVKLVCWGCIRYSMEFLSFFPLHASNFPERERDLDSEQLITESCRPWDPVLCSYIWIILIAWLELHISEHAYNIILVVLCVYLFFLSLIQEWNTISVSRHWGNFLALSFFMYLYIYAYSWCRRKPYLCIIGKLRKRVRSKD